MYDLKDLNQLHREYEMKNIPVSSEYFYDPIIAKERLKKECGIKLEFNYKRFEEILNSSVLSIYDRILSNGALVESFGEGNGKSRYYGYVFSRTVGEYIWPACAFGRPELAKNACEFILKNTPYRQIYPSHIFAFDGSIKSNCLQIDAIGYTFFGIYYLWLLTGDLTLFNKYKDLYKIWIQTISWFIIPQYNLLISGNFNEAIDGSKTKMCELFSNSVCYGGLECIAKLMELTEENECAEFCRILAHKIHEGIETYLKYGSPKMYQVGFCIDREGNRKMMPDNYLSYVNTFASRHMPEFDEEALRNTHEELVRRSLCDFGGHKIPVVSIPLAFRSSLIGKYAGWYLGYTAKNGRMSELDSMLKFISEMTVKPKDIWAESMLLCDSAWIEECNKIIDEQNKEIENKQVSKGKWVTYKEDPDGDYTMDSGNGEQTIQSLEHIVREVIGVDFRNGKPGIHPAFPYVINHADINGIYLPDGNGGATRVGYVFHRNEKGISFELTNAPGFPITISLPVPKNGKFSLKGNGEPIAIQKIERGIEIDRVYIDIDRIHCARFEVLYDSEIRD